MTSLALQHPVAVSGNLEAENWPTYLTDLYDRQDLIALLIHRRHDLRTRALVSVTVTSNPACQFLVGDDRFSRKVMIDGRDPMGIIYIINDDGTGEYDHDAVVDRAVTLGEVLRDTRGVLELHEHKNTRMRTDIF